MQMKIILDISKNSDIKLSLFSKKREVDSIEWQDQNDLSRVLLVNLDKLLIKNGLGLDPHTNSSGKNKKNKNKSAKIGGGLDKISGWQIMSEVPQKWTTYRIADITLKTLKIGQSASSAD
ncbi:MAG: hypothetical protein NT170_04820 [Candidatus Moranbacteria bacterium]|nr:hypothetical protein [Candidatus Moranbacteria bacterium]